MGEAVGVACEDMVLPFMKSRSNSEKISDGNNNGRHALKIALCDHDHRHDLIGSVYLSNFLI
jgi:hypothetical protein